MKTLLLSSFFFLSCMAISFAQNHAPTAVNDTASTFRGHAKINVLHNDYDIDGDNIWVFSICQTPKHGFATKINDSVIEYLSYPSYAGGIDSIAYKIKDSGSPFMFDTAMVYLTVDNSLIADSVNINNINATIFSNGSLFDDSLTMRKFEVPNGSTKSTIFAANLWIGGKDINDTLHLAAMRYGQQGRDYWAGPVSNVYDSAYDVKWNKVWKMTKAEIDYHLAHCWTGGYVPSQSLLDWPGNGNMALGQAKLMAPFYDWNGDSIYDPYAGDYPLIKGDEALFFIFNDDRHPHTESGGNKLGVEIHGMAYEFDCPQDSAFWNSLFINYKIYNHSANQYHSTMAGIFSDFDLGYAYDDYVGCDVERGSFYAYNGKLRDGNGEASSYGYFPPAQSVTFLAGPYMDYDMMDNPAGLCDVSINGFNFGNGINDDERFGMRKFVYFNNTGGGGNQALTDPEFAIDYYHMLNGIWKDSTQMMWGGNAHPSSGSCGPACSFMFPWNSDTCHWGTNGLMPNCDTIWNEITAGNVPYDRRGLGSSGPFTLQPGGSNEIDLAFVYGRNFTDSSNFASIAVMQQRIDTIRKAFKNDYTPCGGGFSGVTQITNNPMQLKFFPNPATDQLCIDYKLQSGKANYIIFDLYGSQVYSGFLKSTKTDVAISNLSKGLYLLRIIDGNQLLSRKFLKQ